MIRRHPLANRKRFRISEVTVQPGNEAVENVKMFQYFLQFVDHFVRHNLGSSNDTIVGSISNEYSSRIIYSLRFICSYLLII
jgi:hypothetical protein